MSNSQWYESVSIPALLRHARNTYAAAMRQALEGAGYDDLPKNGLYVIGSLAHNPRDIPLAAVVDDLGLSKQAAGQLVDTLVMRGYLERRTDPQDRRRLIVSLSERGRDAASVQTQAREAIDRDLAERTGPSGVLALRKVLAALIGLGREASSTGNKTAPPTRLRGAVPIVFVTDVQRAAGYFNEKLGFNIDFLHGSPPFYGAVSRDGARLHFRHVGKPNFSELAAREQALILATIEVSDVHALHAEFRSSGVDITRELVEHDWGGTDFHVRDPDGNEISFVQYRRHDPAG